MSEPSPTNKALVSERQTNSRRALRRTELISDPDIDHHWPLAPLVSLKEDREPSTFTSKELVSPLDTAVIIRVCPREDTVRHSDLLINTLTEDITQRVTLTLPAVAREAEKEDQVDQRKDIAATAKGAGIAGFANLMSRAIRYVTNIAMAHMVSPAIYGAFGEVITLVSLLGTLASLGFGGILAFLLPTYRVKNERDMASGLVRYSTLISLIAGFLLGTLLFAFAPVIARGFYHAPSNELILRELAPLIPLIALVQVFSAGLQALKEIKWKACMDLGLSLITLIALLIFYLLGWRVEALIFSAFAGFVCSLLIGKRVFSKIMKRFTADTTPRYTRRLWFGFALPSLFNEQIFNIANTTDILFLSIFATSAQTGIYIAANRISNLVSISLFALNIISVPLMAEYFAKGKREQLASMFKLVTKWSLSLSLPVCLCCLVFHDAILGIFGAQYTNAWLVLVILSFGNLANMGTGAVLQLLWITRHMRLISIDSITTLILSAGLSFLLVPRFNILGAALAAALVDILANVLCVIEVYWIMKMHPYRWDMCKPLLAGGVATLVGILLRYLVHLQPNLGRFALLKELGLIVPFILVYILAMLLLRLSEEDRLVVNALLAKFGRQRSTKGG